MSITLDYYNYNANEFINDTKDVEFYDIQSKFAQIICKGGRILDFGCGSGRDSEYFIEKGFKVTAMDGSTELCKRASEYLGIEVRNVLFEQLDDVQLYDGIWACASILHVPSNKLNNVIEKMCNSLKDYGYMYASFKYGSYEGIRNGRYFTDMTEKFWNDIEVQIPNLHTKDIWITSDVRVGRESEKWINIIAQKI